MRTSKEENKDIILKHKGWAIAISFLILALIGFVDYFSRYRLGVCLFYIIPITMISWYVGVVMGAVASFVSIILWAVSDFITGSFYNDPINTYTNFMIRLCFYFMIVFIINKFRVSLESEKIQARTDYLTGISNRRAFSEVLELEIIRSRRYKRPFSVAYLDIDNFNTINNAFGHATGDMVLKLLTQSMARNMRTVDTIARIGGDEFIFLMPETKYEGSYFALQRLHSVLTRLMKDNKWDITFSIGLVTFITPLNSVDEIIEIADDLMYAAKKSGKNMVKEKVIFNGNEAVPYLKKERRGKK